ncbi:hypothetical protein PBI_MIMI_133 [Arthrobacter phage Mimi]|nr:hypothetical protein PBI_MIMI_213 [Arthrobacter phage Mimi]
MSKYTSTVLRADSVGLGYSELENGQCRTVLKKTVLVESDKTVAVHRNELIKGLSKNGIPWSRWKSIQSDFFSMKTGNLQSYIKKGRDFHNNTKMSRFEYAATPEVCSAINKLLESNGAKPIEKFDSDAIYRAAYPVFSHWVYTHRALGIRHMGAKTLQEFTLKSFGKTRYRKDLVKAIGSTKSPNVFKNAYKIRGIVPIDWIIGYLKAEKPVFITEYMVIRESLLKMTMQQRKSILTVMTNPHYDHEYMLDDLFDFVYQLPEDVVQSIKIKPSEIDQAHMQFSAALQKIRYADRAVEENATSKFISGIDWSNAPVTMKVGTSTHQIMQWGVDMGHCIGGYANEAANGGCTLTGIYKGDTLIGNAMFRKKSCVQIFGKFNKELPDSVLKPIIEKMKGYRFDNTWGVPLHLRAWAPTELEDDVPAVPLVQVPF